MGFKKDFIWGAASAAYQVEGAAFDDGKGLNIWDTFSHEKGKIYNEHNGDVACDQYYLLEDDLKAMTEIGIKSYRFSVSWARILPQGTGKVNEKGIEFYNRLIDELIKRNIRPCMTLYHWDLPYELHLKGGWLNGDSPKWFEEYASVIKERFGDRVHDFITFNEPQVFVGCGYFEGVHAPGRQLSRAELIRIGHNVLKAHGLAVRALRNGDECKIGITGASCPAIPASTDEKDIKAAEKCYFESDYDAFAFSDAFWFDPVFTGKYPDWVYDFKAINKPIITDSDLELICQPLDFLGLNIYNGKYVSEQKGVLGNPQGFGRTLVGWPITPEALYWGPKFMYERYKKPIIITENGMSCHDVVSLDGKVHDENRIDYLHRYLLEYKRAADDGVELNGYYVWSLTDNFEWAYGYSQRFGLTYIDYNSQERIVKDSGRFMKSVIESNGENL